jgi:hypothetical protein
MVNKVKTSKGTLQKLNEYTICLIYNPDVNIELADAIETSTAMHKMVKEKPYTLLVDLRGLFGNMTNEARNHYANDFKTNKIRIAEALLIDNLPNRILARFYIKINKPKCPVKIFSKKEKAMHWLEDIYKTKFNSKHIL